MQYFYGVSDHKTYDRLILKKKIGRVLSIKKTKEATFESADFVLQMLMFVTAKKEGQMFMKSFPSIFCQQMFSGFQARIG